VEGLTQSIEDIEDILGVGGESVDPQRISSGVLRNLPRPTPCAPVYAQRYRSALSAGASRSMVLSIASL
jgi:hypothetical protein